MNITITDTVVAKNEAEALITISDQLDSCVGTIKYLKAQLPTMWEGEASNDLTSILEDLKIVSDYYDDKIICSLNKLGSAIYAYTAATEVLANKGSTQTPLEYYKTTGEYQKHALLSNLFGLSSNSNIDDYSKSLVSKYGNNYIKIENSYAEVLYDKLNLKEYGYENGNQFLSDYIQKCQNQAGTNREKSIYSALGFTNLASSVNLKADYDWGGGHNNTTVSINDLSKGLDCSGYVSYLVQQGATEKFPTMTTTGLRNIGSSCNISSIQGGDIAVNSGHTMFILSNDVINNTIIATEAANSSKGIIVKEYSYQDLKKLGYQFRDLSSIYNDY